MDSKVSALDDIPVVDRAADYLYIVDTSAGTPNKVKPNTLLGISGNPAGTTDTQTLTNKTITAPTISDPVLSGTITGTYTLGGTPTFPASVVTLTGTQTLTNKTLTSPTINTATIVNPTLQTDTVSEHTSGNGVTIDGLSIKDSKLNTNNSVVEANLTNGIVSNDKLKTGIGEPGGAWTIWTPTITASSGTFTTVSATGKYKQIGKTVVWNATISITTNGTAAGAMFMTLPVTAASAANSLAFGRADSVSGKMLQGKNTSTTLMSIYNYDGTYAGSSGESFKVSGVYEAA